MHRNPSGRLRRGAPVDRPAASLGPDLHGGVTLTVTQEDSRRLPRRWMSGPETLDLADHGVGGGADLAAQGSMTYVPAVRRVRRGWGRRPGTGASRTRRPRARWVRLGQETRGGRSWRGRRRRGVRCDRPPWPPARWPRMSAVG